MHITSKGQVTIPQDIREKFGFLPNTEVEFVVEGNSVKLKKMKSKKKSDSFRKYLESITGIIKEPGLTTDEIMKLTRG